MLKQTKRKITVQVFRPLIEKLNGLSSRACLNRDAYLNSVLFDEAERLMAEAEGERNSDIAKSFAKRCLIELKDLKPTSFNLSVDTANAIDSACEAVNTWRDVFVNRVIYFLVATPRSIESQLHVSITEQREAIFEEQWEFKALLLKPRLSALVEFIQDDPFSAVRIALASEYPDTKGRLHMQPLGNPNAETAVKRGLAGLSTYLPDIHVPTSDAGKMHAKLMEELFAELDTSSLLSKGGTK